jgi:hypothetical protein
MSQQTSWLQELTPQAGMPAGIWTWAAATAAPTTMRPKDFMMMFGEMVVDVGCDGEINGAESATKKL